jgi:hypothetical protein
MKTKTIITSVLFVSVALAMNSCSKNTIWEEVTYGQEEPSYSYGELPAMVQVHTDRVDITLYKNLTHYIYLDGVLVKTLDNEKKITLRALTPNTEYHLSITAMDGVKVLKKEQTFTTLKSYASVIGWREMDLYGNNEEEISYVRHLPGGDYLDFTHRYYYYSDEDYRLRRTDADGRVKWRSNIAAIYASVSEEGAIAAASQYTVWRVDAETGAVVYEYQTGFKEGYINDVYPCKDGGMVIVGRSDTPGNFYFARLDANGQLINQVEDDLTDALYAVHEMADGSVVAMGKKGNEMMVAITFDAEGKIVDTSTNTSEDRDLGYRYGFVQSVRDKNGNTYFLGNYELWTGTYYPVSMIVKVDAQGKIEWVHTLHDEYTEYYPTGLYLIDDDKLCLLYTGDTGYYTHNSKTHMALMTTDNEWLQDITFNDDYAVLYAWPANEQYTQFIFFDKYGRILLLDTEGE